MATEDKEIMVEKEVAETMEITIEIMIEVKITMEETVIENNLRIVRATETMEIGIEIIKEMEIAMVEMIVMMMKMEETIPITTAETVKTVEIMAETMETETGTI